MAGGFPRVLFPPCGVSPLCGVWLGLCVGRVDPALAFIRWQLGVISPRASARQTRAGRCLATAGAPQLHSQAPPQQTRRQARRPADNTCTEAEIQKEHTTKKTKAQRPRPLPMRGHPRPPACRTDPNLPTPRPPARSRAQGSRGFILDFYKVSNTYWGRNHRTAATGLLPGPCGAPHYSAHYTARHPSCHGHGHGFSRGCVAGGRVICDMWCVCV